MDPQAVEEQSQAEQENYKVYKRRWLVLFAMFNIVLVVGLHKSLISIVDILNKHVGMDYANYDLMTQISMYTTLLSVFPMARALDYYGLRRMSYVACIMIICANVLKALVCAEEGYVAPWFATHRFQTLLLSEAFVGFAQSITVCVPAKVASAWFAHYENTLALVITNCGVNFGIGFSNYFTPIFVQSVDDMYKLSYMFLVSGCIVTFIVLTCVTRSSPKMPPSSQAVMSGQTEVTLKTGLTVLMTHPSFLLALFTLTLNYGTLTVTQYVLEEILTAQKYTDNFCGTLIAHAYFFGTFFMLMSAAWIDNSANYVKVSRISCIIAALCISTFNISIILPNIKNVILVTNTMASFGASLMNPALLQVILRSAVSVLPVATTSAIVIVLQQSAMSIFMNLLKPLRSLSNDGYEAPMIIFSCLLMIFNILYATSFKAPSREDLYRRVKRVEDRQMLVDSMEDNEASGQYDASTSGQSVGVHEESKPVTAANCSSAAATTVDDRIAVIGKADGSAI